MQLSEIVPGSMLETMSHLSCLLIFQLSVFSGTLGFSTIYPFRGLVGASPGVYGCIGADIAMILLYSQQLDPIVRFILPACIASHLCSDLLVYLWLYSPEMRTGTASHILGFTTGLFLGLGVLSIFAINRQKAWGVAAIATILSMWTLLMYRHFLFSPSHVLFQPWITH
jgi:hypothetical protein